jgi:hypothetical protein
MSFDMSKVAAGRRERMGVVAGVLQPAQIESLIAQATPKGAFASFEAWIDGFPDAERPRLRNEILEGLKSRIPTEPSLTQEWLNALFAASGAYLRAGQGASVYPDGTSLAECLCALVRAAFAMLSEAERVALFRALLPDLSDLSLACLLLANSADDHMAEALFGSAVAELRGLLQPRVEKLGASGELWQQAAPAAVLWFWWRFAQEDRVYAFVKASMNDARSLAVMFDMLVEPAPPGTTGGDLIAVRRWSKIIDFQSLEKAAVQLALTGASRDDRRRARRFLDAFGNGKSELFR